MFIYNASQQFIFIPLLHGFKSFSVSSAGPNLCLLCNMNLLYKQGLLISEQQVTDTNPLFDLATVPRDLQATSPNSSSQLVTPGTHTTE